MKQTPLQLLDALWQEITLRYCDDQTIDLKESLNAARESLVEIEQPVPYEPDEMDASREARQYADDEADEAYREWQAENHRDGSY
jgi:hypothetical protein